MNRSERRTRETVKNLKIQAVRKRNRSERNKGNHKKLNIQAVRKMNWSERRTREMVKKVKFQDS